MANHTFGHIQNSQQPIPAGTYPLQAGFIEANSYTIWTDIKRHPLYSTYRNQVNACVCVHNTAFAHYEALLMDPRASHFIEAVGFSALNAPPMNMWSDIVRLRRAPNYESIRNIIIADIQKQNVSQHRNPSSVRNSDASSRSLAHLSTQSGHSSRSSRVSSNTDSFIHFEVDDSIVQFGAPMSESADVHDPLASTRGGGLAPDGKCFVCPWKECDVKYFRRKGDWKNHIERIHRQNPPHDPDHFLQVDPRNRPTQDSVESPASGKATTILRSDINAITKSEAGLNTDSVCNMFQDRGRQVMDMVGYQHDTKDQNRIAVHPMGRYGNTGVHTLDTNMGSPYGLQDQGASWFDHGDGMEP